MFTLTLISQRGGCAKTTNATELAVAAHQSGARVLAVDLDPQGHLGLCFPSDEALQTTEEALQTRKATPTPTRLPGLDILPATIELTHLVASPAFAGVNWHEVLKRILAPLEDRYDFVIIDTPATFSKLHTVALVAGDAYVISLLPEAFSVVGFMETMNQAEELRHSLGSARPAFGGYILSAVPSDKRVERTDARGRKTVEKVASLKAVESIREDLAEHAALGIEVPKASGIFESARRSMDTPARSVFFQRGPEAGKLRRTYEGAWERLKSRMEEAVNV